VPHAVDHRRPVAPDEVAGPGPGGPRRWRYRLLVPALALVVIAGAAGLYLAAAFSLPAGSSPAAAVTGDSAGIVRVLTSTGQVRPGPSFPELNGIADGPDGLWLTGGVAGQNHVLFAVDPLTSRVIVRIDLPSRLVINPNDLAVGSGAVWVAVGASLYRVEPGSTAAQATRAFATLPRGGLIGGVVVGGGAVWASDTTRGTVYRFAASTGRLESVIRAGATAGDMAVGDGSVWVTDADARTVSRISEAHDRVESVVTVPGVPGQIAATQDGLWVTLGTRGAVAFVGTASGRALSVPVGGDVTGVAAAGDTVWVANTANGTVSRIDARRHVVLATVPVGLRPYALAADQHGVWVALLGRAVMMHTPSSRAASSATARLLAWVEELCG
jgi:YVTN family beta-propeller protein